MIKVGQNGETVKRVEISTADWAPNNCHFAINEANNNIIISVFYPG